MQLIFPRKQQAWAQSYKDRAAQLIADERMMPPGLKAIEESKRQGKWNDYAPVDALIEPDDLREALGATPAAEKYFDQAAPSLPAQPPAMDRSGQAT